MQVISAIIITILSLLIFILFNKTKKIKADRYLIAFFFTIILGLSNDLLLESIEGFDSFFRFGSATVPLATALIYLYSTLLISSKNTFKKADYLVFLPAIVVFSFNIFFSEFDIVKSTNIILKISYFSVKLGSTALIILFANIKLYQHSRKIKNCFSDIEEIDFKWLKILMNSCLGLFGAVFIGLLLYEFKIVISLDVLMLFVVIAIFAFVLSLAIFGIRNTNAFKDVIVSNNIVSQDYEDATRVVRQDLLPSESDSIIAELKEVMEEKKPYLSEKITISQLSEQINVSQRQLSVVINHFFNMNFFDFINSYRIKEFNSKIEKGEHKNFTILALAYDCGFSSKSAFNRAYKKHTGVPPSEFAKSGTD